MHAWVKAILAGSTAVWSRWFPAGPFIVAGNSAARLFLKFFTANIANPNTRAAPLPPGELGAHRPTQRETPKRIVEMMDGSVTTASSTRHGDEPWTLAELACRR
jgi:hypothetical protein